MILPSSVAIDKERIRRGGLYAFAALAWPHINDPSPNFKPSKMVETVCEVLEDVIHRRTPRHVLNLPPSTGKSVLTGVMLPAYVWAQIDERHRFMYASYDEGLLNRDSDKLIHLLRSSWFVERFGRFLPDTMVGVSNFETLRGGGRFNTSFGGTGTGWHAHTQIVDDPVKAKDANAVSALALDTAWATMSNTYASRYIDLESFARLLVMQRLAKHDPAGRCIAAGWTHTRLPMLFEADNPDPKDWRQVEGESLDPVRYPAAAVAQLKKDASADGPDVWDTQYQLRPTVRGGSILKPEWLRKTCKLADVPPGLTIQSWDLAFAKSDSTDFIAGQWWRAAWVGNEQCFFHLASPPVFERLSYRETKNEIRTKRLTWPSSRIVIENKANGPAVESDLNEEFPGLIELVNPDGSKPARMMSCADEFANGRVIFVEGEYLERWQDQYPQFPRVRRDDEEDATSQAIRYLRSSGLSLLQAAMKNVRNGL